MAEGDETVADSEPAPASATLGGDDLPPSTLIDRYRIEHRLGAGGMGVVYAARDIHLGRTVAVKLVGSRIDAAAGHGRLMREAQAMATLRHPNLAIVHDIGVCDERLFVVLELVEGGTVADWLAAAPRSWREIVEVFLQAARGLAAAHQAGFVHRDFKADNVLLGKDGVARVSDFGVAGIVGLDGLGVEDRGATGVVGTPGYIAPEILRHEAVDARADQFSFCVALYVALYRQRPFVPPAGGDPRAATQGTLRPPPPGPAPRWLARILTRGLASDPRDRWPTLEALAAAIEGRLTRRRRTRWLAVAAAAVAVAGVGMVVAATRTGRSTAAAPPPLWTPVVIGRERSESPHHMIVSPDGSTVASISPAEAWVEPRVGGGARRRVTFPYPGGVAMCRLAYAGDRLVCTFDRDRQGFELWSFDVATDRAVQRLPTAATPALRPSRFFDLGRDGQVLIGSADLTTAWRLDPGGTLAPIATAAAGERFTGWAWSPDGRRVVFKVRIDGGARIEILTVADGRRAVVSGRICKDLVWLSERALACAPRTFRNPLVIELRLAAGGGPATERVRYDGPEYQEVSGLTASAQGVLLSTTPNDQHLGLVAIGAAAPVQRLATATITDLPPAGWTTSGRLIFGGNLQGHLRILALEPDGRVETVRIGPGAEVPLVVLGDRIVFGRFPGGERSIPFFETPIGRRYPDGELFALAPDGTVTALGRTHGFSALLCAGGAAAPCLIAERWGREVIARDWDPATGTRGDERARWLMTTYAATSALSPDGRTLAQVQRLLDRGAVSLLDLGSGSRRHIGPAGTSLDFPHWRPDGTLLAMASSGGGRGIVRVVDDATVELVAAAPAADAPLTTAKEFILDREGRRAAVLMTESLQTHWWIERSVD